VDLWVWIAFVAVLLVGLVAQGLFYRSWLANGMPPGRAALYSIAVNYLPVVLLLIVAGATGGGPRDVGGWAVMIGMLVLVAGMWFGLRRAMFDYADRHGVREEWKRRRR
jgi:hypothetical protein